MSTKVTITLKELADQERTNLIASYGEATFAKFCMFFDQCIEPADPLIEDYNEIAEEIKSAGLELAFKRVAILRQLARNPGILMVQLAFIWFAGHGWGTMTFKRLQELILDIRVIYNIGEG